MKYDIVNMAVDAEELDRAISGDIAGLLMAFVWSEAPQGGKFWSRQDEGETPLNIDALKDIKRQYMHHTGKAGKLKDMHVKAGDVVRHIGGSEYTIKERLPGVLANWHNSWHGGWGVDVSESEQDYTLISLADDAQPDTPKKWGDMTDAEKGALLLASHEGKVIECIFDGRDFWIDCAPQWRSDCAYRVKPEPVRETVTLNGRGKKWRHTIVADATHRVTFDTIDGEPDCSTIKMERITKEESK